MSVIALVPAFDEETRVGATVRAALSVTGIDSVLVVDDGSLDETPAEAEAAGAALLRLPVNGGKGIALDAGLALIRREADVLVLLDADLGETAVEAQHLVAPILSGDADMTVAVFPSPEGKAGFGLVKGLARWGIRRYGGDFNATAPLSGQRALTRRAVDVTTPFAGGYGVEVALTVRALRAGLRVVEIPVEMAHHATGRDLAGFFHRGRQFVHVARTLVHLAHESG